jgi:hypothetical protein
VLDQRGRLLMAALGFAGCSMPSYDRALHALTTWLDSWSGIGLRCGRVSAKEIMIDAFKTNGAVVVEHRYIGPIIGGAIGDGLVVR